MSQIYAAECGKYKIVKLLIHNILCMPVKHISLFSAQYDTFQMTVMSLQMVETGNPGQPAT